MILGTPAYMAPEQMKSGRSADPRSDIWSIGVVIYQMLTGRAPFAGESYADLVLKVGLEQPEPIQVPLPPGLAEVILRCLEKDPKQRHQNVGELARLLAPYATDPIASQQAAGRVARILQQRSMQMGVAGAPITMSQGGLSTPIPLSPAQLTPHTWTPSQATSLSQSAGQVTVGARGGRGWMIGGILSLCTLAGVGGYAVSQLSRGEHADPTSAPISAGSPTADLPAASPAPPVTVPAAATPVTTTPPAGATPATTAALPAGTAPSVAPAPAATPVAPSAAAIPSATPVAPSAAKPASTPTVTPGADGPAVASKPAAPSTTPIAHASTMPPPPGHPAAASKPIAAPETKPVTAKPATDHTAAKPASDPKATADHTAKPAIDTKPTADHTTKPASDAKPATTKPASKPKKADDLFDSRH